MTMIESGSLVTESHLGSSSLKHVLEKVCDIAGIDTTDQSLTWYAIRHSRVLPCQKKA